MVGKPNFLLAIALASFVLCSVGMFTTAVTAAAPGQKVGLFVSEIGPEKVEGEYHGPSGSIQFSSEVQDGDRRFITVTTMEGEPIVVVRKPERAPVMTVKMGQAKFLVQTNEPGSGLPRYSDYVVPQAFHNLKDSTLSQKFILRALTQQLDSQSANKTRRRAIEELAMHSEANSIIDAAKALGRDAGVMGTDSPAAQQFYVLAMRLAKIKEMMQRGAVATSDGTVPSRHSCQGLRMRQGSMYAYEQQSQCPECTTGSCPYMGDRSRDCHGMCGRECSCWWWACGDCCVHQGCLDHDDCCEKQGFWSFACLTPIGFSCSGYSC